MDRLVLLLATGLGVGWIPGIPGTFGSLWGLGIAWGLSRSGWSWPVHAGVLTAIALVGVPLCGRAAALLGPKDPGPVVYDEFAALPVVFLFVEFGGGTALAAFLVFRVFDMAKPWPIGWLERLRGGWGIMADDLGAALLTALLLRVLQTAFAA